LSIKVAVHIFIVLF